MKRYFYTLVLIAFIFNACSSSKMAYNAGNYDHATQLALEKVLKNKHNWKQIAILEKSFNNANKKAEARISYLKSLNNDAYQEEIFSICSEVKNRQDFAKQVLPLYNKKNKRPVELNYINIEEELVAAKTKTIEFLFKEGNRLLNTNNKLDARKAYTHFSKIKNMNASFSNINELINEANFKGTVYTLIDIDNNERYSADNRLLAESWDYISHTRLNDRWNIFHTSNSKNPAIHYDRMAIVKYNHVFISPEKQLEKTYTENKIVEDGVKYVLDKNGNKLKDSLGNFITEKNFVKVHAKVIEVIQTKSVSITGQLIIEDNYKHTNFSYPVDHTYAWENFAATFHGDRRALCDATLRKIGNTPIPFPNNNFMVTQANKQWIDLAVNRLK